MPVTRTSVLRNQNRAKPTKSNRIALTDINPNTEQALLEYTAATQQQHQNYVPETKESTVQNASEGYDSSSSSESDSDSSDNYYWFRPSHVSIPTPVCNFEHTHNYLLAETEESIVQDAWERYGSSSSSDDSSDNSSLILSPKFVGPIPKVKVTSAKGWTLIVRSGKRPGNAGILVLKPPASQTNLDAPNSPETSNVYLKKNLTPPDTLIQNESRACTPQVADLSDRKHSSISGSVHSDSSGSEMEFIIRI